MIRIFFISAFVICFCCCSNPKEKTTENIETRIIQELDQLNLDNQKYPIWFISEGMCSECITKELINIKENEWVNKQLIVLGIFSNKRHFHSIINSIHVYKTIYIDTETSKELINQRSSPFYAIYDAEKSILLNRMNPDPCNAQKTIEYYENIKKTIGDGDSIP